MTKKGSIIILSLAAILLFSLTSCNTDGDDGGQGADFDATQYYTKTQVDGLIASAVTQAVDQATPDQYTITPIAADGPAKTLSGVGWDYKTGAWTVPDGANFGIFNIEVSGAAPDGSIFIGSSELQCEEYPITASNVIFDATMPTAGESSLYVWSDDSDASESFRAIIRYWIK